jgi:two-component system capsular synthesis sensor histidine kinase RcsC
MAKELQGSALSLVNLVSNVLDVTRFDSAKVELQESEFSIGALLEEECRHLMPLARDKGLLFECHTPNPPIMVWADRVKLGRVLGNLLGNAIKFTEKGGVEADVGLNSDGRLRIQVKDTGIGIPTEHQSRIFDEFFQLRHADRQRTGSGAGLGLAICRRLIDAMGGEIEVQSVDGQGSAFAILLPSSIIMTAPVKRQIERTV